MNKLKFEYFRKFFILNALIFFCHIAEAQYDIIEIDTIADNAVKVLPYDKPFTLKVRIETEKVLNVFIIPKSGYKNLSESIGKLKSHSKKTVIIPEIPPKYYFTARSGAHNYLYINFADKYLLKPSSAYYLIINSPETDKSVLDFFNTIYEYTKDTSSKEVLEKARQELLKANVKYEEILGEKTILSFYSVGDLDKNLNNFLISFNELLREKYENLENCSRNYASFLAGNKKFPVPGFIENLDYGRLFSDTVGKEFMCFLADNLVSINNLNTILLQNKRDLLISGQLSLGSIDKTEAEEDFPKRIANLGKSIESMNDIKKIFIFLSSGYKNSDVYKTDLMSCINLITILQTSRDHLKKCVYINQEIERTITTEKFKTSDTTYKDFNKSSIISGNSFLNFETRNKVLLTPDLGIITCPFTSGNKKLDYKIIPYLGFHINLMPVDKDIPFNSYPKDWKQYLSLMVGWSMVNMNQDSVYASVFKEASLLTGIGLRLNNVVRLTLGSQWMFRLGTDAEKNLTKKMVPMLYFGVSFDLNIKQYLNSFADVISGNNVSSSK